MVGMESRDFTKRMIYVALCIFLCLKGYGAVTIVNSASANGFTNALTWNLVTNGANKLLIVGVSTAGTVSSVTYNGINLTQKDHITNGLKVSMWYLIAPPNGNNQVRVNLTGTNTVVAGATIYAGVDQTLPLSAGAKSSGIGITASIVIPSTSNDLVIDVIGNFSNNPTTGAGQTQRYNANRSNHHVASSTEPGNTNTTMSWTYNNSTVWASIGASIKSAAPLPVTLIQYSARTVNGTNIVQWQTASEQNNNFFTLEKSFNGKDFTILKVVQGAGNSNTINEYEVKDYTAQPLTYYRLSQTDYDGTTERFHIIKVTAENSSQEKLKLVYLPDNRFRLDFTENKSGTWTVNTYDIIGKLVNSNKIETQEGSTSIPVQLKDQPKGIYIITLDNGSDSYKQKLIVR